MIRKLWLTFLFLAVLHLSAEPPKYVFYLIGDGMGKNHVEFGEKFFGGLQMKTLPVKGSLVTSSIQRSTTDSAAAGTALACGVKTYNGVLGFDADGKKVDSMAVLAKKNGYGVGILSSESPDHATPASFYAHAASRNSYKEIMEQIPGSKFDLVMGYGMRGAKEPAASEFFRKAGMDAICKEETDFFNLKKLEKPTVVYFPFGYEVDRGDSKVRPLSEYVVKSIDLLEKSCPKGFFMMVEGAKIDHNGHANDGPGMLLELIEFDRVVGKALEFYKKHPKDTLIIVTADHNTGGLVVHGDVPKSYLNVSGNIARAYGLTENDTPESVAKKLTEKGITLTAAEKDAVVHSAAKLTGTKKAEALNRAVRRIIETRYGITWPSGSHTNEDVYLFAVGKGAEAFGIRQENSELGQKLKSLYEEGK